MIHIRSLFGSHCLKQDRFGHSCQHRANRPVSGKWGLRKVYDARRDAFVLLVFATIGIVFTVSMIMGSPPFFPKTLQAAKGVVTAI